MEIFYRGIEKETQKKIAVTKNFLATAID